MNWRWLLWWRLDPERVEVTPDPDPSIHAATDEVKKRQMRELHELEEREKILSSRVTALEYKVGALTVRVDDIGKGD